jgi:hypothetical protein
MPTGEYERYRQQLDAQLRADVELVYEAYRAKLRAYETVARARGEDFTPLPEAELPPGLRPAPTPAPAPPVPMTAPALAPGSRSPKSRDHQVEASVLAAIETLPARFDKFDLVKALGFEPRRSTLHRVLRLLVREGVLHVETEAAGRYPTVYRKAGAPA